MQAETKAKTAKIGMIGLAVMGENLALNIARNGFPIAVFNRDTTKVDKFLKRAESFQDSDKVIGTYSLQDFVASLETPRKIILLAASAYMLGRCSTPINPSRLIRSFSALVTACFIM